MSKVSFDTQIKQAVEKYSDKHVDIIVEDGKVYGTYHSRHDSFSVTDTFNLDDVGGINKLKEYELEYDYLCVCENE